MNCPLCRAVLAGPASKLAQQVAGRSASGSWQEGGMWQSGMAMLKAQHTVIAINNIPGDSSNSVAARHRLIAMSIAQDQ